MERGDPQNADTIHKMQKISTIRKKECNISHNFIRYLYLLHYSLLQFLNTPPPQVHHELTCCHNYKGYEGEEDY